MSDVQSSEDGPSASEQSEKTNTPVGPLNVTESEAQLIRQKMGELEDTGPAPAIRKDAGSLRRKANRLLMSAETEQEEPCQN